MEARTRADDLATLAWWVAAGVDADVADRPRDWLRPRESAPVAAAVAPAPPVAPARERRAFDHAMRARSASTRDDIAAMLAELAPEPLLPIGPAQSLLVLGAAPTEADMRERPHLGGAPGQLFDRMLGAIGRSRSTLCLGTVAFWHAPGTPGVMVTMAFLHQLIALLRPPAILALGGAAAAALTGETGFARLRGRFVDFAYGDARVPLLATFDPAQLIERPQLKALAWDDLQMLRDRLAL